MARRLGSFALLLIGALVAAAVFLIGVNITWGQPPAFSLEGANSMTQRVLLACSLRRPTGFIYAPVEKFGERLNIPNGSFVTIWRGPTGIRPLPPTPLTMTLVSDDPDDTVGGSGMESVRVECLDGDFEPFMEIVPLNGTTPVSMSQDCFRVWRLLGGNDNTNEGVISVENGGTTYEVIEIGTDGIGQGGTHSVSYTIPARTVGFLSSLRFLTRDDLDLQLRFDPPGAPPVYFSGAVANQHEFELQACFPTGTDIEFRASGFTGSGSLSVTLNIILLDSPTGQCPNSGRPS